MKSALTPIGEGLVGLADLSTTNLVGTPTPDARCRRRAHPKPPRAGGLPVPAAQAASGADLVQSQARGDVRAPARRRRKAPQPLSVMQVPEALLTIETVCAVTGLSPCTIYRLARAGELVPARRGNRCTRWQVRAVLGWIAAQAVATEEAAR